MPPGEPTEPTPEPAPRRRRVDSWETVVRQELRKARRRRSRRFLPQDGLARVIPSLREARPAESPQEAPER